VKYVKTLNMTATLTLAVSAALKRKHNNKQKHICRTRANGERRLPPRQIRCRRIQSRFGSG